MLEHWHDGATKSAILDFVDRAVAQVPPEERVAVFDNDGTLWVEKPAYIQLDFLVRRLAEQAAADPALQDNPPYRAAASGDLAWFGDAVTKHYEGDDSAFTLLAGAIFSAYSGLTVEDHSARVRSFFEDGRHPTLGAPYTQCGYAPMVELLRHLEANGFTNYIASGGGRDFMRPVTEEIYGIHSERVIGSSNALRYLDDEHGGTVTYAAEPDVFDDGPIKPIRIWSRIGRRPILAGGNSNGNIPMLRYAGGKDRPALRLLVLHDDPDREFDYTAGAEKSLETAATQGWTVASIKDDWDPVFATP